MKPSLSSIRRLASRAFLSIAPVMLSVSLLEAAYSWARFHFVPAACWTVGAAGWGFAWWTELGRQLLVAFADGARARLPEPCSRCARRPAIESVTLAFGDPAIPEWTFRPKTYVDRLSALDLCLRWRRGGPLGRA